jgi:hypothetical protein
MSPKESGVHFQDIDLNLLLPESASVKGKPRKREVVFSWRLPE